MSLLSNRVKNLAESETLAMARKTLELKDKGIDVINLTLGEPDFFTPDFVKEAAKKAIDDNFSFYTPVPGNKDLRMAIASKLKKENGLDYSFNHIVVSTGAKQSIANLLLALIDEGDEVLIPAPYWVSYFDMVKFMGGTPVVIPSDVSVDFKISAKQIESFITPKTKLFLFSNPCNPSGTVYNKNELQEFADVFEKYPELVVCSDEIYEYIVFDQKHISMASFPKIAKQVVTINGLSKGFAMTGWRLGYLACLNEKVVDACSKIQSQFTSGANSITQKAAVVALQGGQNKVGYIQETFLKRRNFLIDELRKIPNIKINTPGGAFYLLPDFSYYFNKSYKQFVIKDSKDLCMYLLEHSYVGLTPGQAFGADKNLRISYALNEEVLVKAVERIKDGLLLLK